MSPDVLALRLEDARHILEDAGLSVQVSETRPPRGGEGQGALRVIRQRQEGETVHLVVTRERYDRASGPAAGPTDPPSSA